MPPSHSSNPDSRTARAFLLAATALGLLCVAAVWWPYVAHFRTPVIPPSDRAIDEHRTRPDEAYLTLVADTSMATDHPFTGSDAVAIARELVRGRLVLPALPPLPVGPDFDPAELTRGEPVQQLWSGSLYAADIALRAYEADRDPAYLDFARRYVRSFLRWESRRHWPVQYEWTPHAIANRVPALARFWKFTRDDGDPETARLLHEHLARAASMLSARRMFVANTNYGVMQNLALLQIATAFPALEGADAMRELAVARLLEQLPAYVGRDGVVLEHAAGYQFHGVVALGYAVLLLNATAHPVPPELQAAFVRSRAVLQALQRPDGSLPSYGDTYRYSWRLPPLLQAAQDAAPDVPGRGNPAIFPVGGLWVATNPATATHVLVPWGYFPMNGHRRAQEGSVLLWADGTDWLTNTGYWPGSDAAGAQRVEGWDGGSALHYLGERAADARRTRLAAQASSDGIAGIDLVRTAADGSTLRRQVVQIDGTRWLVIDAGIATRDRPLRALWTSAPETTWSERTVGTYLVERRGSSTAMTVGVAGPPETSRLRLRGSREPFAGWVAFDRAAHAAPALELRDPRGRWFASTFQLGAAADGPAFAAFDVAYRDPEHWRASTRGIGGPDVVERQGSTLIVQGAAGTRRLALEPAEDAVADVDAADAAGRRLREAYPRFRPAFPERREWTAVVVALLMGTLAVGAWVLPRMPRAWRSSGRIVGIACWLALLGWLITVPVGQ